MSDTWSPDPGAYPPLGSGSPLLEAPPRYGAGAPIPRPTPPAPKRPAPGNRPFVTAIVVLSVLLLVAVVALVMTRRSTTEIATSPTTSTAAPSTTEDQPDPTTPGGQTPGGPQPSTPGPTEPGTSAPSGSGLPAGDPPTLAAVQALVAQQAAFVAARRGAPFAAPVTPELLAPDAFEVRMRAALEPDRPVVERRGQLLQAMGSIANGVDVVEARTSIMVNETVAYYDPVAKALLVRAVPITTLTEAQLARELTRALDDQRFGLSRPQYTTAEDEVAFTFAAVVDGDAARIEGAYLASLPPEKRQEHDEIVAQAQAVTRPAGISAAITSTVDATRITGLAFVERIVTPGGNAAIDTALQTPPAASALLLHPDRYLAGEKPEQVATPEAEGEEIGHGVFGEQLTTVVLGEVLSPEMADEAADGWVGDAYVLWQGDGSGLCVRITYQMADRNDAAELLSAYAEWARQRGGAQVERGNGQSDLLEVTNCAGGGSGRSPL